MKPENVLKGRMAEALVDELLRKAGCHVYRFGYEAVLQNLTQFERQVLKGGHDIKKRIRSIPDFVVIKDKNPFFIEVKFRSQDFYLNPSKRRDSDFKDELDRIRKFWEETRLIFVTIHKPYFRICYFPYYEGWDGQECRIINQPIETDRDLGVPKDILPEFESLVEKYYSKPMEQK